MLASIQQRRKLRFDSTLCCLYVAYAALQLTNYTAYVNVFFQSVTMSSFVLLTACCWVEETVAQSVVAAPFFREPKITSVCKYCRASFEAGLCAQPALRQGHSNVMSISGHVFLFRPFLQHLAFAIEVWIYWHYFECFLDKEQMVQTLVKD